MRLNFFKTSFILFLIFTVSGCSVFKNQAAAPFVLSDARYYSWFAGEDEFGTTVELVVKNVAPDVTFDSLIFRNQKVPVRQSIKEGGVLLEAVIPRRSSHLDIRAERTKKTDRLIFRRNGRRDVFFLKEIRREQMEAY